jgi:hypothetical protein
LFQALRRALFPVIATNNITLLELLEKCVELL